MVGCSLSVKLISCLLQYSSLYSLLGSCSHKRGQHNYIELVECNDISLSREDNYLLFLAAAFDPLPADRCFADEEENPEPMANGLIVEQDFANPFKLRAPQMTADLEHDNE